MSLQLGNSLDFYSQWEAPTVIVSDGPYGLGIYPSEPNTVEGLGDWYKPHLEAWSSYSLPSTTLWFWNSEVGWATCHQAIIDAGWEYKSCNIWDKGISHIAGNCNTQTIRQFPVVTELCVQYVRKPVFKRAEGVVTVQDWLRAEWERTGLPFNEANEACGVKAAATRKYFGTDEQWYFPPADVFKVIADYANLHGKPEGKPYFSQDGISQMPFENWEMMRSKFKCPHGFTNVWNESALHGKERLQCSEGVAHVNQKPLRLMELIIETSSDKGDVVWEPFGGLCSASIAALQLERIPFAAEINEGFFNVAKSRIEKFCSGIQMRFDI